MVCFPRGFKSISVLLPLSSPVVPLLPHFFPLAEQDDTHYGHHHERGEQDENDRDPVFRRHGDPLVDSEDVAGFQFPVVGGHNDLHAQVRRQSVQQVTHPGDVLGADELERLVQDEQPTDRRGV